MVVRLVDREEEKKGKKKKEKEGSTSSDCCKVFIIFAVNKAARDKREYIITNESHLHSTLSFLRTSAHHGKILFTQMYNTNFSSVSQQSVGFNMIM